MEPEIVDKAVVVEAEAATLAHDIEGCAVDDWHAPTICYVHNRHIIVCAFLAGAKLQRERIKEAIRQANVQQAASDTEAQNQGQWP